MNIDFTDSQQVFNRLAEIQHETRERQEKIEKLSDEQTEADREFDQLERLATAYLRPHGFPVVLAIAYEFGEYSRKLLEYALISNSNGSVTVRPFESILNIGDLEPDEIHAALADPATVKMALGSITDGSLESELAATFHLPNGRLEPADLAELDNAG